MNDHDIEVHVERLCGIITGKTAEFWEERNRAVLDLTAVLEEYPATRIHSVFKTDVLKHLVQPIKELIMDLRSQQVRDTCTFLIKLSEILEEEQAMRLFVRDVFDTIFLALKAPHKLMSGYVDECIMSMIRNTTFKSGLQLIVSEIKESKSKHMRERSMDYIGEILIYWELSDREIDYTCDVISLGLEDASAKAREFARVAYLQLKSKFPKRAEKLKAHLQVPIRAKLSKMEDEHDVVERKKKLQASTQSLAETGLAEDTQMIPGVVSLQALVRGSITRQSISAPGASRGEDAQRKPANSAASSLFRKVAVENEHHGTRPTTVPHMHKHIVPPAASSKPSVSTPSTSSSATAMSHVLPSVGDKVSLMLDGSKVQGTVKFFGSTEFAPGDWVGIFLDTPNGKNDGSVKGQRYFTSPMGYGLFSRPSQLTVESSGGVLLRGVSSMSEGGLVDTKPLCSILKIKIAKSLELLSAEMSLVEMLESPENFKLSGDEYDKILTQLSEVATEGVQHLQTFKNDIDKLNSF